MKLVLIHGSGDNRHIWRLQMEQFGKGQAFALDLPGHGERAELHEITVPTLILCGREDKLTPPKYSQFLAEKLTGVKQGAELQFFPDAGHYVMREQAESVNRTIANWLSIH